MVRRLAPVLLSFAVVIAAPCVTQAQTGPAKAPDQVIEQAAEAATLCEAKRLTLDEETQIARQAAEAGPDRLIGDRLTATYAARDPVRVTRFSMGCKDPAMQAMIGRYDQLRTQQTANPTVQR